MSLRHQQQALLIRKAVGRFIRQYSSVGKSSAAAKNLHLSATSSLVHLSSVRFGGDLTHDHKPGDGSVRGVHRKDYHDPTELTNVKVDKDYIPGTDPDTYAHENPYPQFNKGRLDWLFDDGWRRPPDPRQAALYRGEWVPFGFNMYDEYDDWITWHNYMFILTTGLVVWFICFYWNWMNMDNPHNRSWAIREGYLEIARRKKAGLPLISKDLVPKDRIVLPSEEELDDMEVLI